MRITFLGTNGWYATKSGNTVCTLIESKNFYVVFDAGDGIHKLNRYAKKDKPIYLFLSHLHLDHIIGFHAINKLDKLGRKKPFFIFTGKGNKKFLDLIIRSPFTVPFKKRPFPIKIVEISEGKNKSPFPFTAKKLYHADPSLGYRLEIEGKIITYCSDTGPTRNVVNLAKESDFLIHECSASPGVFSGKWGHTNPQETASIAKKARVKKLILTHFSANQYLSLQDRRRAQKEARKIFKNTVFAKDDLIIKI
ncbi:MAG: ribonuclease Z [Candidatus Moranbacteria bacterium]|nr:ribonuclease Z [Candidatus Moranbacteria bacterium]